MYPGIQLSQRSEGGDFTIEASPAHKVDVNVQQCMVTAQYHHRRVEDWKGIEERGYVQHHITDPSLWTQLIKVLAVAGIKG